MKKINARSKGANGERELSRWLLSNLDIDHTPTRNLEQVRNGGADIIDVYPFSFECKRVELLDLQSWWIQAKNDCANGEVAVVAFRRNRQKWEFLISAKYIGAKLGFIRINEKVFIEWANSKLKEYYRE